MAQVLFGKLTDSSIEGVTRLSGHFADPYATEDGHVGAGGVLASGGYFSPAFMVRRSFGISENLPGASFVLSSDLPLSVSLPRPSEGLSYRFILGDAPSVGHHSVDAGSFGIHGGVSIVNAVPGGAFASGASMARFSAGASAGARFSLYADGGRWYVADGLGLEPQSVTFV